jgi:hypothetical protein
MPATADAPVIRESGRAGACRPIRLLPPYLSEETPMKPIQTACALLCLFAGLATAQASPKITAVSVSPAQATPNQPVTITVKGEEQENAIFAFKINFGDGSSAIKHMDWGKNVKFPMSFKKHYLQPGKYKVGVVGVKSGSVLKCLGQVGTLVKVNEPAPAAAPAPAK